MNLYLVHCGFYDDNVCGGLYESHVNYFVVSEDFSGARRSVKEIPEFKLKKMHVDGLREIKAVGGYAIELSPVANQETEIVNFKHRDMAPKKPQVSQPEVN